MTPALDWLTLFNIIGISNGLFLALIILKIKKGRKTVNRLLSAFILALSFSIPVRILNVKHLYLEVPHLLRVLTPIYWLLGPLLLFYVKAITNETFTLKRSDVFHLIPFGLQVLYNIPFYLLDGPAKIYWYSNFLNQPNTLFRILLILKLLHLAIYLVLALKLLRKHATAIKDSFSTLDKIKLAWLRNLLIAFSLVLLSSFLFSTLRIYTYGDPLFQSIRKIFYISETFILFFIGFKGLTQPDIFSAPGSKTDPPSVGKYRQSTLTDDQAEQSLERLLDFMEREKPYMDSEVSIKILAEKLDIPYFYLSQVINEKLNRNFFDFINRYRVEEVKRRLELKQKLNQAVTILAIAYESGFNSKTSFNQAFKKYTHTTPSQYLKNKTN